MGKKRDTNEGEERGNLYEVQYNIGFFSMASFIYGLFKYTYPHFIQFIFLTPHVRLFSEQ